MDTVINRLSDIEKAAVSVMDGASERKKQMAREMEEKTAAFDRELEQKTAGKRKPGSHFPDTQQNGRGITAGVKTTIRGCQSYDEAPGGHLRKPA